MPSLLTRHGMPASLVAVALLTAGCGDRRRRRRSTPRRARRRPNPAMASGCARGSTRRWSSPPSRAPS